MRGAQLYQIETWLFVMTLLIGGVASAQDFAPQIVAPPSAPAPASSSTAVVTPTAPATTAAPIFKVVPNAPQPQQQNANQNQEMQALLKAFGGMMGGGAGSGSTAGSPSGASDVAGSAANSGSSYGGSTNGMTPSDPNDLNSPYKIVPPFKKWFINCSKALGLGACKFVNMGIVGDEAHKRRRSCHNDGQAIDVGPITCSGGQKFGTKDPMFFRFAQCMANESDNELQVIYYKATGPNMIQKSDHDNHMHIQLMHCAMVYGGG